MPPSEREANYERGLRRTVRHAYAHSPAMRHKLDSAGIRPSQIRTIKDLEAVPVTPKEELRRLQKESPPFGGLVAVPVGELKRIFVSPGPIFDFEGHGIPASEAISFYSLGFRPGDLVMNSFSYHLVRAGWAMDEGLVRLGCVIIASGVGNTELQVQVMHDLKVTGFAGTPSFLMTVIKKAESLGYNFRRDFSLKVAYLGAEPFPPSMRKTFEEDYGISTGDIYGTADLGGLAYSCPAKSGLHIQDEVILEIVDPATGKQLPPGEMGEVVVTSLNKVFPAVRIGLGDLSYYTDEPCSCGRTARRLVRIAGRVGETVKVRGIFIQPKEVEELVKSIPQIRAFQMMVSRAGHRDELGFRLELAERCSQSEVCEALQNRFQDICRIKIDSFEIMAGGALANQSKKLLDNRTWD